MYHRTAVSPSPPDYTMEEDDEMVMLERRRDATLQQASDEEEPLTDPILEQGIRGQGVALAVSPGGGVPSLSDDERDDPHQLRPSLPPPPPLTAHPVISNIDRVDVLSLLPSVEQEILATGKFKWPIPNLFQLEQKDFSPVFTVGGVQFRIMIFPRGNSTPDVLSLFLECVTAKEHLNDQKWACCALFALSVSHPLDATLFESKESHHRFTGTETDWGFSTFLPLNQLHASLMKDHALCVYAHVALIKDETGILWRNLYDYDSKSETGYVGLKNQGATCYMNSLLQSLYFTSYFTKAVFQIPTESDTQSVPLALQRVFYHLLTSDHAVSTLELTKSFGWDSLDSFMQHDVQEFNRVLQDNLEAKMKGTQADGAIQRLFVGRMKSYVKCIHVQFESSRTEDFYDIQLNVKGFPDLKSSFDNYISVEVLDGENKYMAEGHGLQAAKKGVIFEKLPPVLHLQLKRFEYDYMRDQMVKINDRFEFPEEIDLSCYVVNEEEGSDKSKNIYRLHGVLVHAGDVHGGHYCAYLKPDSQSKWFKFDDDRVTCVTLKEAMEGNYGSDPNENVAMGPPLNNAQAMRQRFKKFSNAYMLVYVRVEDAMQVLAPLTLNDIPPYLAQRFTAEREQELAKIRAREEQHFYLQVQWVDDALMRENSTGLDLVSDWQQARQCRLLKSMTLNELMEGFLKEYELQRRDQLRLWVIQQRQNKSWRPAVLLTETNLTLEQIRSESGLRDALRLYVEYSTNGPLPVFDARMQSLIFIKYFNPEMNPPLFFLGHFMIQHQSYTLDSTNALLHYIEQQTHHSVHDELLFFEEVKSTMIQAINPEMKWTENEIGTGDVICIQAASTKQDLKEYFDYLVHVIRVEFLEWNKDNSAAAPIVLELSKKMTLKQVATSLAPCISYDPEKLRFYQGTTLIRRVPPPTLQEMLWNPTMQQYSTQLLYEKLELTAAEMEQKRSFKVILLDPHTKEKGVYDLLVSRSGTVRDLTEALLPFLNEMKTNFTLTPNDSSDLTFSQPLETFQGSGQIRWVEVMHDRISQELKESVSLTMISDLVTLYAEEASVAEVERGVGDKMISVFHFYKEIHRTHSIPFRFLLLQGEPFSRTKWRLQSKLFLSDKEFSKFTFHLVSYQRSRPIQDDECLADLEWTGSDYLGLDHVDKSGRGGSRLEKGIKILN